MRNPRRSRWALGLRARMRPPRLWTGVPPGRGFPLRRGRRVYQPAVPLRNEIAMAETVPPLPTDPAPTGPVPPPPPPPKAALDPSDPAVGCGAPSRRRAAGRAGPDAAVDQAGGEPGAEAGEPAAERPGGGAVGVAGLDDRRADRRPARVRRRQRPDRPGRPRHLPAANLEGRHRQVPVRAHGGSTGWRSTRRSTARGGSTSPRWSRRRRAPRRPDHLTGGNAERRPPLHRPPRPSH